MTDLKSENEAKASGSASHSEQPTSGNNSASSKFQVINRTPFKQTLRLKPTPAIASSFHPTPHSAKTHAPPSQFTAATSQLQSPDTDEVKDELRSEFKVEEKYKPGTFLPLTRDDLDLKKINTQSYSKTVSSMLEEGIRASDFLPVSDASLKHGDAGMDLTCKEEFGDSEHETSDAKNAIDSPPAAGATGARLRDHIETQLTSHLLASAGVLSTYKKQVDREFAQKQAGLQQLAVASSKRASRDVKRDVEPRHSRARKRVTSRPGSGADISSLPPKKRALLQQPEDEEFLGSSATALNRSSPALKDYKASTAETVSAASAAAATRYSVRESVRLRLKKRARARAQVRPDSDVDDVTTPKQEQPEVESRSEDGRSADEEASKVASAQKRGSDKNTADEEEPDDDPS